jgi:voltage-gated potassium channel
VVSPYVIGGQRVAQAVLRPAVMDFIELATRGEHLELQIEETEVAAGSSLAGTILKDSGLRQDLGIILVAIKKPDGKMVFNPPPEAIIEPHDLLISLGPRHQLDRLERSRALGPGRRPRSRAMLFFRFSHTGVMRAPKTSARLETYAHSTRDTEKASGP